MKKILYLAPLLALLFSLQFAHAAELSTGCTSGDAYSRTTGQPCIVSSTDCQPGDLFSSVTGNPCQSANYLPGCYSLVGYSITTGTKCDSSPVQQASNNQTVTLPSSVTQSDDTSLNNISATVSDATPTVSEMATQYVLEVMAKYPQVHSIGGGGDSGPNNTFSETVTFYNAGIEVAEEHDDINGATLTWYDGTSDN